MKIEHILIIRTGALGDVILTLPVIHNLHAAHPNAHIHLLGNPRLLALAKAPRVQCHDVNRAHWASLFVPAARPSEERTGFLGQIDLAISYLPDPDGALTDNLHRAGISSVHTCPPRPANTDTTHAVDHLLSPLSDLGIPIRYTRPLISLTQTDRAAVAAYESERPTLIVHPGSGSASKCWPPESFAQTADCVAQTTGCRILISSGPADGDRAHRVAAKMTRPAQVLPELPIRHLAALMCTCTAYLGNDSGPSHLSAAVGLPTVALFGPTDPTHWAPRGETVCVIWAFDRDVASITPGRVIAQLLVWTPT